MGRSSGNPILGERLMFTPNSGSFNSSIGKGMLWAALFYEFKGNFNLWHYGTPGAPIKIEISLCHSSMKGGNSHFLWCSQSNELKCYRVFSATFVFCRTEPFALLECMLL